jgi:indole-3-acetate monooxygenase
MDHPSGEPTTAAIDETTATSVRPLDRARAVSGLVRDEALASERLGRLTDKAAAALLEANLFSVLVPPAEGGLGGTRAELFEAVEEIAAADGSAAWCLAVCNGVAAFTHLGGSAEVRREVFGDGPVACWGSLMPTARSKPAAGGFRVLGDFRWGSGSSMARWVRVAAPLEDRGGQQGFRSYIIPKDDVEITDGSWDVMGLRATASIDYSITNKFVPVHRTNEYPYLPSEHPHSLSARWLMAVSQIGMAAFASGIGARALAELIAAAPKTKRLALEGVQADDHMVQFGIGELDGRLRAARRYYLDLLHAQDQAQGPPDPARVLDLPQAAQTLSRAARDATVFAFDNAGTSVVLAAHPLQRCLRDIFTGLKQAALTPGILGRIGKARLGMDFGPVGF